MEGSNKRPDNSTRQDVLPDQSAVGQHARIGALFVGRRVERGMEGTEQKELESPKRESPAAQKKTEPGRRGLPWRYVFEHRARIVRGWPIPPTKRPIPRRGSQP